MISVEVKINRDHVEDAMVDMNADDLVDMVITVMERVGSARLVKSLIGELGGSYTYLKETFGDGAE